MNTYTKLAIVSATALLLGGCSLDINGILKGEVKDTSMPTPTPYTDSQTSGTPNPSAGSMESGSYSLQGTTSVSDDSDAALEKDLNDTTVNSNLEMMVR